MLEPTPKDPRTPPSLRAIHARTGFDLEPELPDPAPAHVDPEGAMHPALFEPMGALPLHSFPTPGARAALAARVLSEPGRADPDDGDDPFVRVFRLAAKEAMEPEVTGVMALVLLRGLMSKRAQEHSPPAHAPSAPWEDPDHDPFRRRRPRLSDLSWDGLWTEIAAADSECGLDPVLEFERITLRSAAAWLRAYRAWWGVAGDLEEAGIPEDAPARADLRARLWAALAPAGAAVGHLEVRTPVGLLQMALEWGCRAEAAFLEEAAGRPRGPVTARWLLEQQLRALKDLARATRERSLVLHRHVRRCDRARLVCQIAYRLVLLDLWLAPEDEAPALEAAVLAIPAPPHRTTLSAGLGRTLAAILSRRLRRGDHDGAQSLARRAIDLAPGELSALVTHNDLAFAAGRPAATWSPELLDRLRAEQDAWDGPSVRGIGVRVARGLGDGARGRWFGRGLTERARAMGDAGWLLAASESLIDPAGRQDSALLESLAADLPPSREPTPLDWIAQGCTTTAERDEALESVELALTSAVLDLDEARSLVRGPVQRRGHARPSTWKRLVEKPLPASPPAACGALWVRVQDLRAASPALRAPAIASALRAALAALADAAPLAEAPEPEGTVLLDALRPVLEVAEADPAPIAAAIEAWTAPLLDALRAPRRDALHRELAHLEADLRVQGAEALRSRANALRAEVDAAVADDASLEALHSAIAALRQDATSSSPEEPGLGLMQLHREFDAFSLQHLHIRPEGLRQAHTLVRLFNLAGGHRDRKRLKGTGGVALFELRKRTEHLGGIRVFYRPDGGGWQALAAMSKYDDRQQDQAIGRVLTHFAPADRPGRRRDRKKK